MRHHLVLYDGDCGLCSRLNLFLIRRDRRDRFRFAPLQSATGRDVLLRHGREPGDLDTFRVVTAASDHEDGRLLERGRAAVFVLTALGGPWRLAALLRLLPRRLLDAGYDFVARRRHRFGPATCALPTPDIRAKFLEL